ncbi:MAG: hypothetical protein D4R77_11625 [Planctomycetaceae bacterium]|nr:MAG: hypothetical protein D4R77_11625 [Planctomycetaceae bacterium]
MRVGPRGHRTDTFVHRKIGDSKKNTLFGVPFADYKESCRRDLPVWHVDGKEDTKFYFSGFDL